MRKEYDNMKEEIKNLKTSSSLSKIFVNIKTLFSYCLKCRKNTESKNPKVVRTKSGGIILLSKYSVCNNKELVFIGKQEIRGSLSNLTGVKIPIKIDLSLRNSLF